MVKRLKCEDFINELDKFFMATRDKNSVYITFKRIFDEKFKNKKNKKIRKLRIEDRLKQVLSSPKFDVLVRARLKKSRIQTIVKRSNKLFSSQKQN
jgi:hypothetical protein